MISDIYQFSWIWIAHSILCIYWLSIAWTFEKKKNPKLAINDEWAMFSKSTDCFWYFSIKNIQDASQRYLRIWKLKNAFQRAFWNKKLNWTYLRTTLDTNPALSAFLFEKSDVNIVCVNFNPYSAQSNFRVAKKWSPILRPRYFRSTDNPKEPI